tara:strand:- start:2137 stop:2712 length:576 start_codon:yes stop_codon:yes gene_type:complete
MQTLHQTIEKASRKTYGQVNRMWPDNLPYLESDEALRAYKRLVNKFGKKETMHPTLGWRKRKLHPGIKKPRKCWVCLSGDSSSLRRGWRRLVHDVSHRIYDWRFPKSNRHHDIAQARIEQEMSQFVIDSGWLDGKLKSKSKAKPTKDEKQNVKIISLEKLIKSWETKEKRAKTYINKYKTKLRRMKIRLAD